MDAFRMSLQFWHPLRDLQFLREQARNNIGKYIDEILPRGYQKCLVGLDAILTKTWDIVNSSNGVIPILTNVAATL
jgi:hypothetical protein